MTKKTKKIHHKIGNLPVIIYEDELGGYWVDCPVLDGCHSQGKTVEDCLKNIREAIDLCLEDMPTRARNASLNRKVSLHLVTI